MLSPGTGRERKGEVGMLFSHAKAPINVAPAASSPATSPACLRVGVLPTENVADQLHCTSAHTVATDSPLRCEALSSPRSYWEVLLGQPTMIGGERSPSPMLLCQQAVKSNDLAQVVAHVQHHGIEMRGKNGFQALHFASCYGKCDIAAYLLHPLGADVNAQTARGNTPLHIACFENFLPMIELLVRHGADFTVLNWQQKNAVDMAQRTYTLQTLMRALSARGGGVLMDPSEKLWLHYYKFFGLTVGAGEAQLGPSFKKTLKNIFTKRDMSDEQRHVDLQEACEAYLVLRSSNNRKSFEQAQSSSEAASTLMRIEFIDQHYLDVFIKRQMHDALKALPSKISSSMTAPTSSQETKATAKVVVDFCNSLSRSAGSRGYFPESPLPDVSMMTASPDGASLAVSPMNSVFAASRGSQYRDSEEIVIESPLVKFSSPLAQAAERNGALMLGALTYSSPACGALTSSASASGDNTSPISVTAFSLSQWKTATPRQRDLNDLRDRDGEIFIETCSDDLRERETTSDDLLSVLEAAAPSPLPLSNFYQEFIAVDSMPLPSSYIEFSSHSHSTPSKMGGVDERQQHRSPAPGSNSKSPCLPKPPRVPSASRGNPTRDCGEGSGQGEVTDGSAGSVEVESCSSCFDKFLSAGYGELSECDLEPQQQMQVHVQQLQVKKEQQEENGTEIALSGTVHAKAQGSDVIVASDSELGNDIRIQVAAEHGDNSELLSLLRGLLNKKNTEIQTLTAALHKTQALSDSLRQDLSLSKTDLSHLSAALINKEGEVAKHRHSLQVRDNTLQRQLRDSSSRCAHLSERVTSLEAQNESLRQLQQDQALRNQVEQHLLNERMEDSLRLVAALEGKSTAAEREKELLLMHATHRLQAQELCVREYRQQLEQALSDKIRIERGIAQGGVCSNGSNSLDVCISSVSSNRTTQVLDTQKPLPCNFTHYLPSCMDVLQSPVAHRDNAKSGAACVGRAQQAQHGWAQDVIEVTDGVMGRSVTENCRDAHTKTSEILFVHNQILCNEVIRLRQALASDERDSSSLFPPLHSSSRAPPPTSGRGDSGEKTSDKTAQDKMSRPSGLMRCEIETHAPSYFSPSSPAASFFKDTDVAGVSPGVSGGGGGGERGFGLQQTTSAAITKDLKAEADMVSWQWMAAMDGAGVQRAAQATVLFASPPPQLSRDYEPLSDWV